MSSSKQQKKISEHKHVENDNPDDVGSVWTCGCGHKIIFTKAESEELIDRMVAGLSVKDLWDSKTVDVDMNS